MQNARAILIFVIVVLSCSATVSAAPSPKAFTLFAEGYYEEAAAFADDKGGAENHALAARALNAEAYLAKDNKMARRIAKRALAHAEIAIQDDPNLVEGHLQAAISYAQRGARMSPVRAFVSGTAQKARALLDHALQLEPENAWALSSSGAWHLEVARRAGEGRYGAKAQTGIQQFAAARATDPANLLIAYEAALRILAYEEAAARGDGLQALKTAMELPAADAFESDIKKRAALFQAAVNQGKDAERAFIEAQP